MVGKFTYESQLKTFPLQRMPGPNIKDKTTFRKTCCTFLVALLSCLLGFILFCVFEHVSIALPCALKAGASATSPEGGSPTPSGGGVHNLPSPEMASPLRWHLSPLGASLTEAMGVPETKLQLLNVWPPGLCQTFYDPRQPQTGLGWAVAEPSSELFLC